MVSERHRVDASAQERVIIFGGQPRPAVGVFGVGDHKIDRILLANLSQIARKDAASRPADDVSDHENAKRVALSRLIHRYYSLHADSVDKVVDVHAHYIPSLETGKGDVRAGTTRQRRKNF